MKKMYKYLIKVTAKDIAKGQKELDSDHVTERCAVALALKRAFKTKKVGWGYSGGNVGKVPVEVVAAQRTPILNWVCLHDSGKEVSPISFYVESTQPVRKGASVRT